MPIYKQDASGKFAPFEETPFPDLEKAHPQLIFGADEIAFIARKPRTARHKEPNPGY